MSIVVEVKKYRIRAGYHMVEAIKELISIAKEEGVEIEADFNGRNLTIFPEDTPLSAVER
ncbi:MAG TPA: hypothetical protein VFK94_01870 [Patescibacteria group bacterium]|nr:hypothetical protein [Patescibacteria group bacterium]